MRIVCWNCNGALRQKAALIDALQPDLFIGIECEDPSRSTSAYARWANRWLWAGANKNKGIGVFARRGIASALNLSGRYRLSGLHHERPAQEWATDDLQLFLPFEYAGLRLLAVWTKGSDDQVFGYVGQLWKYWQIHRTTFSQPLSLVIGDLNSNQRWDKQDRWWNHSDVVAELSAGGLESLYHYQTGEAQGSESSPTFYLHRHSARRYHIDYAFLSKDLLLDARLTVGDPEYWLSASDHMPLIVDLPNATRE